MNSIFLRIYAGMMLAVLVVSLIAYAMVQLVNQYRSEIYREAMAHGTFHLLAQGFQRQSSEEELEARRALLSRLFGVELKILSESELSLSYRERLHLEQGLVVMRIDERAPDAGADILYQLPGEPRYVSAHMTRVSEQHARATALLVLEELARVPAERWDDVIASLQPHFGYGLSRVPRERVQLDLEQLERLERQEVVIALRENRSGRHSGVMVYAPLGPTDVLVLGPLALFDWTPVPMLVIVGLLGLFAMGGATYALVRPLQNRLRELDHVVRQLGGGNMEVQARVGPDAIGQLGSTFNGMKEHIRRLIDAQREMTRAVSHELRTPVARLRFGLEMLADCDDADERRVKLDELDQDIEQLDQLIDEILTFARLEEGSPTLDFKAVDLRALFGQICREIAPISGALVLVDASDWERLGEASHAEGEERYLHRILQNLVTNALRYARSEIVLRFEVADGWAIMEVADDGPGIPAAERERVFKPFARLDKSRHRASGGYGLGLSIVQRIVEWHGGRIEIDDSPQGGALFRVLWPREQRRGHHALGAAGGR